MLAFTSVFIVLLTGAVVAFALRHAQVCNYEGNPLRITLREFALVGPVLVLVTLVVTVLVGPSIAQAQAVSGYKEFWNGSVTKVYTKEYDCTRDGPCTREYQCDPYEVVEVYTDVEVDSKGNTRTVTKTRTVTRYHDCPYTTREYSYFIDDSLGRTHTIASHIFASEPRAWRSGMGIPDNVARGVPERWQISKTRLDAGDAEPVTKVNDYDNFLLASQDSLLKQYSTDINNYRDAKLLPGHTVDVGDKVLYDYDMQARKIQFAGMSAVDESQWQKLLMQFNAALGSELQGDLHVVVVPASKVANPDAYINALVAHWQTNFKKWGFPKNGIALAIGVSDDTKTIAWARAKTGLPIGNGEMLSAMQFQLERKPFKPEAVLGEVTAQPYTREDGKLKVRYTHTNGTLDQIMFKEFPFKRPCMECKDKEDNGISYAYLIDSVPVSTGAKIVMFLVVMFVSVVLWWAAAYFNLLGKFDASAKRRKPTFTRRRNIYDAR